MGKKPRVFEASGQTDSERRELRRSFRQLNKSMTQKSEELEDAKSKTLESVRAENNELWDQVRYTREAVLDGENLDLMATRAARQVDKLVEVPRYDAVRLTTKLRQKLATTGGVFDWQTLGIEVGVCFNAVPSSVSFLAGPLDADYTPKERKKPQRRKPTVEEEESDAEEESPEDVKKQTKDADKQSAVERNIEVVHNTLKKKSLESRKRMNADLEDSSEEERATKHQRVGEFGAINFLFNPKSFTQTVENIFHFSFLLKHGNAKIYNTKDSGPMVQQVDKTDSTPIPRQAIVSLNMRDWRQLSKAYEVNECTVPHRTGTKHARRSNQSSSQ